MAEEFKNNSYKFRGTVVEMPAPKTGINVSGEWMVQQVVVEEDGEYKKKVSFEIFGKDRCEKFNLHVGDKVLLSFNLVGTQYKGKYYTTCRIWNCHKYQNENAAFGEAPKAVETKKPVGENKITDVSDLPF